MANIINVDGRPVLQVLWHLDDVHECAQSQGIDLTDEQANKTLGLIAKPHDATIGVNVDVINHSIQAVLTKTWG